MRSASLLVGSAAVATSVAVLVEADVEDDHVGSDLVVQREGKSPKQHAAKVAVDDGTCLAELLEEGDGDTQLLVESRT